MIEKGQKYIKILNGLKFIISDVSGNKIQFHEEHYFAIREMNEVDFLKIFKLEPPKKNVE